MAATFLVIQSTIVGAGGTSSIVFSNIPQTYKELELRLNARTDKVAVTDSIGMYFNASQSGYTTYRMNATVSSLTHSSDINFADGYIGESTADSATANCFSTQIVYIPNYTNSSYNKSWQTNAYAPNNGNTGFLTQIGGVWTGTAAISSITLRTFNNTGRNFNQGTIATLYGINDS